MTNSTMTISTDDRAQAVLDAFSRACEADRAKTRRDGTVTSALTAMFEAEDSAADIQMALGLAFGKIKAQKPSTGFNKDNIKRQYNSYKTLANRVASRFGFSLKTDAQHATDGFVPCVLGDPAEKDQAAESSQAVEPKQSSESSQAVEPKQSSESSQAVEPKQSSESSQVVDVDKSTSDNVRDALASLSSGERARVIVQVLGTMRHDDLQVLAQACEMARVESIQPAERSQASDSVLDTVEAANAADAAAKKANGKQAAKKIAAMRAH